MKSTTKSKMDEFTNEMSSPMLKPFKMNQESKKEVFPSSSANPANSVPVDPTPVVDNEWKKGLEFKGLHLTGDINIDKKNLDKKFFYLKKIETHFKSLENKLETDSYDKMVIKEEGMQFTDANGEIIVD